MPVYFAYGSNMDVAAMARRCPRSRVLGAGRLARHRFALMPEGYATVVRDPRRSVHGLLWDLALSDVRALDAYEEVGRGLYRKVIQPVIRQSGGAVQALVYVGRGDSGHAQPGYMESVIAAAQAAGLPGAYVTELHAFAPALRQAGETSAADAMPRVRPRFATPFERS
jgi:gamma-glutamylcyclotransferase (GGCT)/AIG2-like uncharacterized protein YtfP